MSEIVDNTGEIVEIKDKKKKSYKQFSNFNLRFPKYLTDYNITITDDLIERTFKEIGCTYFFILHDKDINENEIFKYNHYHAILILNKKRTLNSLLKEIISSFAPFVNDKLISNLFECKCCYSLYGSIQYLTHKNESEEKYKYDVSSVISNNYNLFNLYYNNGDTDLTIEDIDNIIVSSGGSYKFIIYKVGMKQFTRNFKVIEKLYKYYYGDKDLTYKLFENGENE